MKNKNIVKVLGVLIIVLIIFLITWFSSKPGNISMGQSDRLLLMTNLVSDSDIANKTSEYYRWRFIVRKGAHFFLFMVLGIGISLVLVDEFRKTMFIIIMLGVFDEFHQIFTGRGASLSDVVIDIVGGFTGWLIVESIRWLFKKNEKERKD